MQRLQSVRVSRHSLESYNRCRRVEPVRVGIISLSHESNTFIKTPTTLSDFERHVLLAGSEFRQKFGWKRHEVAAFFDTLAQRNIEAVPIFMAAATPSGTITREALSGLL